MDIQYNRNEDMKTDELPANDAEDPEVKADEEETTTTTTTKDATTGDSFKASLDLNDDIDLETTVIFLPNIWSLMPNSIEYQTISDAYKNLIENPPMSPEDDADEPNEDEMAPLDDAQTAPIKTTDEQGDEKMVEAKQEEDGVSLAAQGGDSVKPDPDASKPLKAQKIIIIISVLIFSPNLAEHRKIHIAFLLPLFFSNLMSSVSRTKREFFLIVFIVLFKGGEQH